MKGSYVAVRYVDRVLDVSPGVPAEAVESGLLLLMLLLLQLQRLDLGLQLLQLVLQMFALLHVLQPASINSINKKRRPAQASGGIPARCVGSPLPLDLHGQPFHVRVLEVEARRIVGEVWGFGGCQRSRRSRVSCYELEGR